MSCWPDNIKVSKSRGKTDHKTLSLLITFSENHSTMSFTSRQIDLSRHCRVSQCFKMERISCYFAVSFSSNVLSSSDALIYINIWTVQHCYQIICCYCNLYLATTIRWYNRHPTTCLPKMWSCPWLPSLGFTRYPQQQQTNMSCLLAGKAVTIFPWRH